VAKLLDTATANRIRAELHAARQPSLDKSFIDRIDAIERAIDAIVTALEK
jgi:hypothetical protein